MSVHLLVPNKTKYFPPRGGRDSRAFRLGEKDLVKNKIFRREVKKAGSEEGK